MFSCLFMQIGYKPITWKQLNPSRHVDLVKKISWSSKQAWGSRNKGTEEILKAMWSMVVDGLQVWTFYCCSTDIFNTFSRVYREWSEKRKNIQWAAAVDLRGQNRRIGWRPWKAGRKLNKLWLQPMSLEYIHVGLWSCTKLTKDLTRCPVLACCSEWSCLSVLGTISLLRDHEGIKCLVCLVVSKPSSWSNWTVLWIVNIFLTFHFIMWLLVAIQIQQIILFY